METDQYAITKDECAWVHVTEVNGGSIKKQDVDTVLLYEILKTLRRIEKALLDDHDQSR